MKTISTITLCTRCVTALTIIMDVIAGAYLNDYETLLDTTKDKN